MYRRLPAYLLLVLCLISSCKRGNRVIPKDKFAEIYAEMFVLDQWLDDNRDVRRMADTTLVYAPVLDKYGYSYNDYLLDQAMGLADENSEDKAKFDAEIAAILKSIEDRHGDA